MIRFWEKETREAKIFRVEGFGLFTLGRLPAQACETGSAAAQGPPPNPPIPQPVASGTEQELHLGTALPFWQGGVRSCKCCRTLLLSWAALQRPGCQTELREAPKYADVLYEHDFRALNFTEAQNRAGKLSCDSALRSHMWTQKHTKVKNHGKKPQTSVFQIWGKKKIKKYIFLFWFKALVSCCLTKLGHQSVRSSGFLRGLFFNF